MLVDLEGLGSVQRVDEHKEEDGAVQVTCDVYVWEQMDDAGCGLKGDSDTGLCRTSGPLAARKPWVVNRPIANGGRRRRGLFVFLAVLP